MLAMNKNLTLGTKSGVLAIRPGGRSAMLYAMTPVSTYSSTGNCAVTGVNGDTSGFSILSPNVTKVFYHIIIGKSLYEFPIITP